MRVDNIQILDTQAIYLCQECHSLTFVSFLWFHHLRSTWGKSIILWWICLTRLRFWWSIGCMNTSGLQFCLQSFPCSTYLPLPNLFSFHFFLLANNPHPQQKLLPTECHHCFSQSTNLGSWQPSQIPLSASILGQGSYSHHLNISALLCSNLFVHMEFQPRNSPLAGSGLQTFQEVRSFCLRIHCQRY